MSVLDGVMLGAFVLFIIFMIRGVALQTQEKDKKRSIKKDENEKIIN